MANNPLVPTPIVDKNGVYSVRHKKSAPAQSASRIPIPKIALVASTDQERASIGKYLTGFFQEYGFAEEGTEWDNALNNCYARLSDDRLEKVREVCMMLHEKLMDRRRRIGPDVTSMQLAMERNNVDAIDVYHRYREEVLNEHTFKQIDDVLSALEKMELRDLDSADGDSTTDAHIRASIAYVPISGSVYDKKGNQIVYATDKHLMKFVERHPDRVDDIMKFRRERDSSKYADLERYFKDMDETGNRAVMDGWL